MDRINIMTNTEALPIVSIGTYDTELSPNFVFESEYKEQERLGQEEVEFDFLSYLTEIGKIATGIISDVLSSIVGKYGLKGIEVSFDSVSSPREYNFTSDKANISISISYDKNEVLDNFSLLKDKAVNDFWDEHYRSRSGFISFCAEDEKELERYMFGDGDRDLGWSQYLMFCLMREDTDIEILNEEIYNQVITSVEYNGTTRSLLPDGGEDLIESPDWKRDDFYHKAIEIFGHKWKDNHMDRLLDCLMWMKSNNKELSMVL